MGAYDYVTKPFSLSILQARVHAVLRRKTAVGFRIALQQNEAVLIIDNKEVTLTKKGAVQKVCKYGRIRI